MRRKIKKIRKPLEFKSLDCETGILELKKIGVDINIFKDDFTDTCEIIKISNGKSEVVVVAGGFSLIDDIFNSIITVFASKNTPINYLRQIEKLHGQINKHIINNTDVIIQVV